MPTPPAIPDRDAPLVLVTERPAELSYEAYKELQRQQARLLKAYKRGRLVHVSRGYERLGTADGQTVVALRTQTYRKPKP